MTRFLLAVYTAEATTQEPMTDEEMRQGHARVAALEQEMRSVGALVFSGRLDEPGKAAVVNAANGKALTTDGPFAESKEAIGGFYIVEAEDRDAALAWASKTSAAINMPIEVRPFFDTRG